MYLLDTNAIIYYLRSDPDAYPFLKDLFGGFNTIYISVITEAELFSFSNLGIEEATAIEEALHVLSVIPLDSKIARIAAQLRREYRIQLADAVIAATSLFTGSIVVTRNVKDFKPIPNLSLKNI